jgi:hypothetical protein
MVKVGEVYSMVSAESVKCRVISVTKDTSWVFEGEHIICYRYIDCENKHDNYNRMGNFLTSFKIDKVSTIESRINYILEQ